MGYVMTYESAKNEYIIKPANEMKSIDKSKIGEEVREYKQNIWVGKSRDSLKEYKIQHQEEQIAKHMKAIERIQKRTLSEVKQQYNHA
ncbi:hypothetical protein AXY43_13480 [Clostridium sp. MF28]|uniref:hypothetical protein n=1 Tax=Clostridium TaxID=1485 RepID=UPI000CF8FF8C|nr:MULTISPECIES: hypothetical protein [Clostridium]AVK48955.1 hypothetical protein AXY43_13480 [Clostridium sp. MF28]PSM56482.1 hypothetical protein C4L39_17385 [Clostridium diolis]